MGADYTELGLSDKLQSQDSLAVKQSAYTTSLEFDSEYEGVSGGQLRGGVITTRLIINDGTNDRVIIGKLD